MVFVKMKPSYLDTLVIIWFINIILEFLIVCSCKMLLDCIIVLLSIF